MLSPLQPGQDQIERLVRLVQDKRFESAIELAKSFPDVPEVSLLHALALLGAGKLFLANTRIKHWILIINRNTLIQQLVAEVGFSWDEIYEQCAPHDLGYLMWAAIESNSLKVGKDPVPLLSYKIQLLHPSRGLSEAEQQTLFTELKALDPSPEMLLHLATKEVPATTPKYSLLLVDFMIHCFSQLTDPDHQPANSELIMSAVNLLIKAGSAGNIIADKLLQKVLLAASVDKMFVVSGYLALARKGKKDFQEQYIEKALNLVDSLPAFIDDKHLTLQMKWQRLIDYVTDYSKRSWGQSNQAVTLAGQLLLEYPVDDVLQALVKLTNTNKLREPFVWMFLQGLYSVFMSMGAQVVRPLLPEMVNGWGWSFGIGGEDKSKLMAMLVSLAELPQNEYLRDWIREYHKEETEWFRQRRLAEQMHYEKFERDRKVGGYFSDVNVAHAPPEPVLIGAAAPPIVEKGSSFTGRFVAYEQRMEEVIRKKIFDLSPRSTVHASPNKCYWQLGTEITVRLSADNLIIENPEEQFTWEGGMSIVDFDVRVPDQIPATVSVLKFDILIAGIRIGKIRIDIEVGDQPSARGFRLVSAQPFRYAFASYASKDRGRVLDRVAEINRNGVDVFIDCLSMRPGDQWKPVLEKEIERCSSFLLFWSVNARASEMVSWEWHTALRLKGIGVIDPHPLDPVMEAPPPDELSALHFGDVYMIVRKEGDNG